MSLRCSTNCPYGEAAHVHGCGRASVCRLEMVSRAVHPAARGVNVKIPRVLIESEMEEAEEPTFDPDTGGELEEEAML
uniref:Uncharacterized protein n=1 Tax=Oryza meridionalis TaxID=40149 RepID=A0A0E0F126_9ORYZ